MLISGCVIIELIVLAWTLNSFSVLFFQYMTLKVTAYIAYSNVLRMYWEYLKFLLLSEIQHKFLGYNSI